MAPTSAIPPPAISCFIRFCSHRVAAPVRPHFKRSGHPMLSHGRRLYLHPLHAGQTTSGRLALLLQRIVVEPSPVRGLAADCPLLKRLGSRHAPSVRFFLLLPPSHMNLFHFYVVVHTALGVSSSSICFRMGFHHTLHGNYLSVEGLIALAILRRGYHCRTLPGG